MAVACGYQAPKLYVKTILIPRSSKVKDQLVYWKKRRERKRKWLLERGRALPKMPSHPPPCDQVCITTQELLKQADAIAASNKDEIEILQGFERVVQRAINARRRCCLMFSETLKYWVVEAPLPSVKALCDQQGLGQNVGIEDLPREARKKVLGEMRARGLRNDNLLPEHRATAENRDLKPIKRAKDPNFLDAKKFCIRRYANIQPSSRYGEGGHHPCQSPLDDICHDASVQFFTVDKSDPRQMAGAR